MSPRVRGKPGHQRRVLTLVAVQENADDHVRVRFGGLRNQFR